MAGEPLLEIRGLKTHFATDDGRVQAMLKRLDEAARSADANLVPVFIESVENYVTIGEICDVLRGVFGEQRESLVI